VGSSHEECLKILMDNTAYVRIKKITIKKMPLQVIGYLSKYKTQKKYLCEELLKKQIGDKENVLC
jgi:hypothetical protein